MADYTTTAKVAALLPAENKVDDSTTDPTLAQLSVWITQVSQTVDVAVVSSGGAVPISDTAYLGWLDLVCAKECAFLVMQVKGASEEKASLWQQYHKEFMDAIEAIKEGLLPGEGTASVGGGSIRSYTMGAETSTDASLQPLFTTDKRY